MLTQEFDYHLPTELIAQKPLRPRDHSRLMILNRSLQTISHDFFYNLSKYLIPHDLLIANNSQVIPARLIGQKNTQGKIEILLLSPVSSPKTYQVMVKGKIKPGQEICFKQNLKAKVKKRLSAQTWTMEFNFPQKEFWQKIEKIGQTPTPPYIKRVSNLKEYQTIYAQKRGSAAAPTAGFHFTNNLIKKLAEQNIFLEFITLHVGLGTFQPVRTEKVEDYKIHPERAEINPSVAKKINQTKEKKQRVIAVGTTTTRVLEDFYQNKKITPGEKWVKNFIYPGYKFKIIDGLITNFHLPQSSLLMMVSAFAGKEFIKKAYGEAIKEKYRFYSFGDAMLII
jgi:S-adenosylmethionine:tRNA ribosyltransferase-isomerase